MNKLINYKRKNINLTEKLINLLILIKNQFKKCKILKIFFRPKINKVLILIENPIFKLQLKI